MLNAYIYDGVRTPFGRHAGALSSIRPDDLAAYVIEALVNRHQLQADAFDDVILGNTNQAGEDSRNLARHAALLAGLNVKTPGQTINRLCASGLAAVIDAARAVTCGEGELFLAGGVESMSRAPFVFAKSAQAFSRDFTVFDSTIGARFPNPKIEEIYGNDTMPETGDNVAEKYGISREEADKFAAASQAKYEAARKAHFFDHEIISIEVDQGRKRPPLMVAHDEHPRPSSTVEVLSKLKPLQKDGVVTAGNASGINDGAAILLIGSAAIEDTLKVKPIAKILASGVVGVEPRVMGIGPIEAINIALMRANLTMEDMDIIEINEAFASQVLACLKGLNISFDDKRVNPNGGAIAMGHPLGASGARLVLTTARELQRTKKRFAVISLCIGVGQGLAVIIENPSIQDN